MGWYCALTELLNKDRIVVGSESFETIRQQLEKTIVTLYKALLLYQMKSVCSYYRSQVLVFFRSLANLDNWDDDLKSVTDAEVALQTDSGQYNDQHAKSLLGQLINSAKERQSRLGDIHQDLREFIDQQQKKQADSENKECLRDLRVVNPQDDMKRIESEKEELFDDAYKWILEDDKYAAFTNWDESDLPPCQLLWVKGRAGTGKTMLLIGIIRELSDQPAVLAPTLSYFFCQGQGKTDRPLNNATVTLRSLIWMLLIQQPHLISHLQTDYRFSHGALFTDTNALVAMSRVFKNMLEDARPVYFIVDALDECDQGLGDLIKLISTSLTLSNKVRWLVSSRPEVDVLFRLKNPDISRIVDLNAQGLDGPVNAYIGHKLSTLKGGKGYTEIILAEVSNQIRQRAENIFLWVALVFKRLEKVHGQLALENIKDMPPGLSELYDHMMTRIEKVEMIHPPDCKKVLMAISLAYRRLTLPELAVLASLRLEITQTAVEECGSFLTTTENTVSLIHQSAKDYLEANYQLKLQPSGAVQGHADISRRSIDAMSKKLEKDIYTLQHVGYKSEDLTVPSQDPLEGLRYCCVYWVQHLQKSSAQLRDNDYVHQFLQLHLLHWLEALGWIGKTSEGILAILSLEAQIPVSTLYNIQY
jgi:hypothetical protein